MVNKKDWIESVSYDLADKFMEYLTQAWKEGLSQGRAGVTNNDIEKIFCLTEVVKYKNAYTGEFMYLYIIEIKEDRLIGIRPDGSFGWVEKNLATKTNESFYNVKDFFKKYSEE